MIDEDHTDADLEALLRSTFASEARQQVPDNRAVPPFPETTRVATVHPIRRRWVGLSVVAAALVAVAIGATVLVSETMDSERTPIPPATTGAPTPTVSTSVTAPPTTSPTSTPSSATSTAPPPAATKQITVLGIELTVPTTWNAIPGGESVPNPTTCLTTGSAVERTGMWETNCELNVDVGGGIFHDADPDSADFTPDGGICGTDGRTANQTVTTSEDQVVVDGQTAEHRVFTGSCVEHPIQQWTVVTSPVVEFTRMRGDPAGDAQALAVVRSARLPGPRSARRVFDRGYITGVSGATVSLDRITVMAERPVVNNNPATYDYPVAGTATIEYVGGMSGTVALTLDQLRALAAGQTVPGVPALDSLVAQLDTDGTAVTRLNLYPRSS